MADGYYDDFTEHCQVFCSVIKSAPTFVGFGDDDIDEAIQEDVVPYAAAHAVDSSDDDLEDRDDEIEEAEEFVEGEYIDDATQKSASGPLLCASCGQVIRLGQGYKDRAGVSWHDSCFTCQEKSCSKKLSLKKHHCHDKKVFCKKHLPQSAGAAAVAQKIPPSDAEIQSAQHPFQVNSPIQDRASQVEIKQRKVALNNGASSPSAKPKPSPRAAAANPVSAKIDAASAAAASKPLRVKSSARINIQIPLKCDACERKDALIECTQCCARFCGKGCFGEIHRVGLLKAHVSSLLTQKVLPRPPGKAAAPTVLPGKKPAPTKIGSAVGVSPAKAKPLSVVKKPNAKKEPSRANR